MGESARLLMVYFVCFGCLKEMLFANYVVVTVVLLAEMTSK